MSSKKLIMFGFVALAALPLLSCNYHFREPAENDAPLSLTASESGCMLGASNVISEYFAGKASPEEIKSVWTCISKSLKLFTERTHGAKKGIYKPDELRYFLEKYFLNKKGQPTQMQITDGLLREFMELKSTLLGGEVDELTIDELNRLRDLIDILQEQSLALRAFVPLTKEWAEVQTAADLDLAIRTIEAAGQALAKPLQNNGKTYAFEHFKHLKDEFEKSVGSPIKRGPFAIIVERMSLVEAFKSLSISPPSHLINGYEWVDFLTTSARWYGIWLKSVHLKKNYQDFTRGEARERLVRVIVDVINILDESVARHPPTSNGDYIPEMKEDFKQAIPFSEIEAVLDSLKDDELPVPDKAKDRIPEFRKSIKAYFKPFIRKVVGGADPSFTGRKAPGLTHGPLRRVADFVEHWSSGQLYLEELFRQLDDVHNHGEIRKEGYPLKLIQEAYDIKKVFPTADELPAQLEDAVSRLKVTIDQYPGLFKTERCDPMRHKGCDLTGQRDMTRIFIDSTLGTRPLSFGHLTKMNIAHEMSRLLIEGYAADPDRAANEIGLDFEELYAFFDDFYPIGRDIRFFDPNRDNRQMIGLRFLEGNLFTYASNGGEDLNPNEATQLLVYLFSVYQRATLVQNSLQAVARKIEADAKKNGKAPLCKPGEPDAIGEPTISPECFRAEYFKRADKFWADTPDFYKFYQSLPDKGDPGKNNKETFKVFLETAARLLGYSPTPVMSSDHLGFAGVVYYVESLIQRFDTGLNGGRDGQIDQDEAEIAFPMFKATLKKMVAAKGLSKKVPDEKLRALFTYLLNYGKIPSSFGEKWDWFWWSQKDKWEFKADRLRLIKIFALLSSNTEKGKNASQKIIPAIAQ